MKYYVAAAALFSACVPLSAASACSVVDDYRVPTNLELVEGAELILLGRVVGETTTGRDASDNGIVVEPVTALRGAMPSAPLVLNEMALTEGEFARYGLLSNPFELEGAHPASYIGGCIRYFFPRGTTALFFLEKEEDGWRASGGPFSRWAEDVVTEDAPWLELARFYAGVVSAPAERRRALLAAERDRLAADENNPVARLMAEDVQRQLDGPNPAWNDFMRDAMNGDADIAPGMEAEVAASEVAEIMSEEMDGSDVVITEGADGHTMQATIMLEEEMQEDSMVPDLSENQ